MKHDLNEDDYFRSIAEIDACLNQLTTANIMEIRSMAKPHPMIEKAMQVVCALKGFKNLNWVTARDLLSRNSLKVELK